MAYRERNFSPQRMFFEWARTHRPACSWDSYTGDWASWTGQTRPAVLATLGQKPTAPSADPELIVEWTVDGLRYQRWVIDVGPFMSAPVIVCHRMDLDRSQTHPAILCWHGHGSFGKDAVMGFRASPSMSAETEQHNYDYGRQMALAGYVTYAMDWMGVGERNDNRKPHFLSNNSGRDWCNLYYLHATMLGMTSLGMNIAQGMAMTDFVCTLPFVDPGRLGVMGLSGGGTMTLWTALCDVRMKAAEIICYSDLWAYFGMRDLNYCGMQVAPGLFALVDLPDLTGLLAPLPLLVDIGVHDSCFHVGEALACYQHVRRIYEAAGVGDRLHLDQFAGEHAWGGNASRDFFAAALRGDVVTRTEEGW